MPHRVLPVRRALLSTGALVLSGGSPVLSGPRQVLSGRLRSALSGARSVACPLTRGAYLLSGTCSSEWAISSMDTSRKVSTFADFTNRAGRYMSHTQASPMDTS